MTRTFRTVVTIAVLGASATLMVGCATGQVAEPTGSATSAQPTDGATQGTEIDVAVPIQSDVVTVAGTTVELKVGDFFDVEVPQPGVEKWQATMSTDNVVQFFTGEVIDGVVTPPEFAAVRPGTTQVTMTDGTTTVKFTITVTL